jgi:hypothetical protein
VPATRWSASWPAAAIAALDDAAGTIEFSRAITKPRLGVDLIEIAGDRRFSADLASSLVYLTG